MMRIAAPLALTALFGMLGCGGAKPPVATPPTAEAAPARPSPFVTQLDASNPLVGKVWSVGKKSFADDATLLAAARGAHFVFLGEKHDNPDHHRLQAWVIEALVRGGRKPSVAMEQFDVEQQGAIDEARKLHPNDADAIATATHWSETGWPSWDQYAPIVRVVVDAQLPLVAANLSRARAKALVRGGPDAMSSEEKQKLGLDRPLDAKDAQSLRAELNDVHCGMPMPPQILDGMAFAERARDATMADRIIAFDRTDGSVLVAGTGHTRVDRGVPAVLQARGRMEGRVSIAFVEVSPDVTDPAAYGAAWHVPDAPFDFLLFTPRANDEDPCAGMRMPHPPEGPSGGGTGGGGGSSM